MKSSTPKFLSLACVAALILPAACMAQGMGQQQQGMGNQGMGQNSQMSQPPNQQNQQGQAQQKPATPATPTVNPAEEAAWKKLASPSTDANAVVKEAEDFLKKYNTPPAKSVYADRVYGLLAHAYMQEGEDDKMFGALRAALDVNPDNVEALSLQAMARSRRIKSSDPHAAEVEQGVTELAQHGIEVLNAIQKPEGLSDADFQRTKNEELAMCHSALGRVAQLQGKPSDAATEFQTAVSLETPPDAVDEYLLGMSLMDGKQYAGAVTALQGCLKDPGPMKDLCTDQLAAAKKAAASAPKQ